MNIHEAYLFGKEKFNGKLDDDGLDYFDTHCWNVVEILTEVTQDTNILIAGLLHDIFEDTDTTYDEVVEKFGNVIASLIAEVTHEGKPDEVGYYFPRLKSKEAILIKFADRLSNLSRINSWSDARQGQYLRKSKFWRSEVKK